MQITDHTGIALTTQLATSSFRPLSSTNVLVHPNVRLLELQFSIATAFCQCQYQSINQFVFIQRASMDSGSLASASWSHHWTNLLYFRSEKNLTVKVEDKNMCTFFDEKMDAKAEYILEVSHFKCKLEQVPLPPVWNVLLAAFPQSNQLGLYLDCRNLA